MKLRKAVQKLKRNQYLDFLNILLKADEGATFPTLEDLKYEALGETLKLLSPCQLLLVIGDLRLKNLADLPISPNNCNQQLVITVLNRKINMIESITLAVIKKLSPAERYGAVISSNYDPLIHQIVGLLTSNVKHRCPELILQVQIIIRKFPSNIREKITNEMAARFLEKDEIDEVFILAQKLGLQIYFNTSHPTKINRY